ncbi:MAG: hypothetical protein ACERKZ_03425 [Lachnotalea sp.]
MEKVNLHFLENRMDYGYVNFGTMWDKGKVSTSDTFNLNVEGEVSSLQTRVTAYWPDGSVKWAAHCADIKKDVKTIEVEAYNDETSKAKISNDKMSASDSIQISEDEQKIVIDTGEMKASFQKKGSNLVEDIIVKGRNTALNGQLICILEERVQEDNCLVKREISYQTKIQDAIIEEQGALKIVIKVTGIHRNESTKREVLPFIVRFTMYLNKDEIHITHTFLYDGDPQKDFLKGLGISFECPIEGAMYNRHVKMLGDNGVFHEAMQLLLSWRPPVEESIYKAQLAGEFLELNRETDKTVFEAIDDMTIWSNYHMLQEHANHYLIKKRTGKKECCYIHSVEGEKAKGVAYVAGENGGIAIGMRNFWEKYPSSLWVDDVEQDTCKVTAWIWSPEVEAMDYRHYDTLGHASAYYEGFDEVGATPYGIANTNEIIFKGYIGKIVADEELEQLSEMIHKPAVLVAKPKYYHDKKAFGIWSLPSYESKVEQWLENQMNLAIEFYKNEVKARGWYGLYNYGDFMHTYDKARHCWRYDMGGYAWQNTELVPTYWLWYAFLRTGREDIYTLAEAMARHCSEVDVYHLGDFKGIGSRHNVIHWGCSCKEPRIAMAGHHRVFYYLTGDHRMEDIFEDVKDGDLSSLTIDPLRFFYDKDKMVYPTHARSGPDWSSYVANWMTQWEHNQDEYYKNKILTGIEDLKQAPMKLASGSDYEYDPESGHLRYIGEFATGGSHLALCMGAAQIWTELADIIDDEEWTKMIADFGVFYFDTPEERQKKSNHTIGDREFDHGYMAASMAAFGAFYYKDKKLAQKVWNSLFDIMWTIGDKNGFEPIKVSDYVNNENMQEISWISTNYTSQWCLNIIVALELIKEFLPDKID